MGNSPSCSNVCFGPLPVQEFRYINIVNGGHGTVIRPLIKDDTGCNEIWKAKDHWHVVQGKSRVFDAGAIRGNTIVPGENYKLGISVLLGDNDWVDCQHFQYHPESDVVVTIRKHGGTMDGDASFDGTYHHGASNIVGGGVAYDGAYGAKEFIARLWETGNLDTYQDLNDTDHGIGKLIAGMM